ncbi:MAG: hypothetical protein ACSHWW_07495 [Nonlabens sp.]|uniref:hypothetical protein n=1 Tax=Nonlabens sp. TaxID=1888209 RepID=UPI003EF7C60B
MKNYVLYFAASLFMLTSCSPDEIEDTSTPVPSATLSKYVKYNIDLTVNPPVALDSTVYTIVNDRYQEIKIHNNSGSTKSAIFNYVNNKLDHIDYYNDGVLAVNDRERFTYGLNGLVSERISHNSVFNIYTKSTYQKIADTTYVDVFESNDGINFIQLPISSKAVTDSQDKVTYLERNDINGNDPSSYITYTYDAMDNLIVESKDRDYDGNGNLINDITFTMTYSNIDNPIASLRNNTYSKYFNNINYYTRSGSVNLTIGPAMISPQQLNTYSYSLFADFPTTITNQTNTDGNIDTVTYVTVDPGGVPYTSFSQKFFYQ